MDLGVDVGVGQGVQVVVGAVVGRELGVVGGVKIPNRYKRNQVEIMDGSLKP